jgi:hypothetical protein
MHEPPQGPPLAPKSPQAPPQRGGASQAPQGSPPPARVWPPCPQRPPAQLRPQPKPRGAGAAATGRKPPRQGCHSPEDCQAPQRPPRAPPRGQTWVHAQGPGAGRCPSRQADLRPRKAGPSPQKGSPPPPAQRQCCRHSSSQETEAQNKCQPPPPQCPPAPRPHGRSGIEDGWRPSPPPPKPRRRGSPQGELQATEALPHRGPPRAGGAPPGKHRAA